MRLPTRRADWRLMGRTARLVLGGPLYALVALVAAAVAFTGFVLSQNLALTRDVLAGRVPASVLPELYPFVGTSYSLLTGSIILLVALLVGVDIALVAYHVREHRLSAEGSGGSLIGVLLGTLGAGCAACGSAVLAGLLSLVGAAGILTLLPLDGLEFALLALAALVLSIYWLADGMRGGEIRGCPVDK
ncbi:hypothetical protein [Haloplanus aerogenes]|uniref:Uncharacterized protein n=1 Tax=Haloplanus aerogenes TaxID=660522 RepID=A0A3M0DSM5_9EURY|nr:hypothetical protein [Haloplanus aerogenes]AZH25406.1 hypothetical protein DU502_08445 [Haloplanus aerogenes]RMB25114.1 hypothetical protein ATH50_0197 [Haloplanus aerogenes]